MSTFLPVPKFFVPIMQEIADITEFPIGHNAKGSKKAKNDIEVGLEIVALEMGNILEELKDNLQTLSWNTLPNPKIKTVYMQKPSKTEKPYHFLRDITNTYKERPNNVDTDKPSVSKDKPMNVAKEKTAGDVKKDKQAVSNKEKVNAAKNEKTEKTIVNLRGPSNVQQKQQKIQKKPEAAKKEVLNAGSLLRNSQMNYQYNRNIFGKTSLLENDSRFQHITSSIYSHSQKSPSTSMPNHQHNHKRSQVILPKAASPTRHKAPVSHQCYVADPLKPYKDQVENAMRNNKTFTVCGNYFTIRRALLARGWVEKLRIMYNTYDRETLNKFSALSVHELLQKTTDTHYATTAKKVLLSKLLGNHQVDFYWDQNLDCFKVNRDSLKVTLINRFRRGIFSYTSKQGLSDCMKTAHWYHNPGHTSVRHPRTYNLSNNQDPRDFINDFKLTAALSLLKWVVKLSGRPRAVLISAHGKVSLTMYNFAFAELGKIVQRCNHKDIDFEIQEALESQWNTFLEAYYKIVHLGNHFKTDNKTTVQTLINGAKLTLQNIEKFWPYLRMDGYMNIWILKPTNGSRGEGIYLCRTLQYVLKVIKSNSNRRYVIQKYIERPLLIYNTKFDIRQWFLISNTTPLTIWIYKECYIRFSSQLYNLSKLHESIHLTNNSIQCRYKNCTRNPALPEWNMWDVNQFESYLTSIGHPRVFREIIYPGMKECIRGAILMNQDNLDKRKNSFELYGSDFMLTEDFKPWLIEINSRPALYASTPITSRLCPQVLDDLVRVVIDHARNPHAKIGQFELLYKENVPKLPDVNEEFVLKGHPLPPEYFYTPENDTTKTVSVQIGNTDFKMQTHISTISMDLRKTLENLLNIIHTERERRNSCKSLSLQTTDVEELYKNKLNVLDRKSSELVLAEKRENDTIQIIRSIANNLRVTEGLVKNLKETKSDTFRIATKCATTETAEDDRLTPMPKSVRSENQRGIFTKLMDSLRNLNFIHKHTT